MAPFQFDNGIALAMAAVPALLNLGIATFVLLRMRRNALTYVFVLFVVAMAIWQMSEACTRAAESVAVAQLCRDVFAPGALVVAPLGMHFALLFSERRRLAHSPMILILLYGPSVVFEVLNRAGLNESPLIHDPIWGWKTALPVPVVSTFSSYWIILLTFGTLFVLASFAARLPADDERKHQARLVAGGLAVPLILGAATQVMLPTLFNVPGIPLTSAALTIFSVATVVALRQYRFLSLPTLEERLAEAQRVIGEQQALLAEAERMAQLGSWEWRIKDDVVRWSAELFRIFDVDPAEFRGTYDAYLERVHPDDRDRVGAVIGNALERKSRFDFEHRIVRPGGDVRIIHSRGGIEVDADGDAVRMAGTAQDVTERQAAERDRQEAREQFREVERLKEVNLFKTRFINMAAHELMTPLTPLRALLYAMARRARQKGEANTLKEVEILRRNVERLNRLVSDLLDASRLEAQKMGIQRRPTDLGALVSEVVAAFKEKAGESGVKIETRLEPGVIAVVDPDRLTQALFNLLSNAVKFTPSGGRIGVIAERSPGGIVLRVKDTGVGIDETLQRQLFRPFSRAHVDTEHDRPGTGLGLYITKGIIDLHGGQISVESPGEGKGTTFTVVLPG